MASCPWCGSDLFGYTMSTPEKNIDGRKITGVACCPSCKWSGIGENYIELDDDNIRISY